MSTTTTNYGLTKQAAEEYYNVEIQNDNMDIIDTTMKGLDISKEGLIKNTTEKTTLVDADALPLIDSVDSSKTKKVSFENLKKMLKTIFATTEDVFELNSSLSDAIKKDGSVQMTGVLKTVGWNVGNPITKQCEFGTGGVYVSDDGSVMIISNAYYDGINWRYKNNGSAGKCAFSINGVIQMVYATSGISDAVITWVDNSPLTKSGIALTGNINITKAIPVVDLVDTNTNDNCQIVNDIGLAILRHYDSTGGANFADLRMCGSSTIYDAVRINYRGTDYKIYGEHNITVSTVAPSSALAEGAQHQVYA